MTALVWLINLLKSDREMVGLILIALGSVLVVVHRIISHG